MTAHEDQIRRLEELLPTAGQAGRGGILFQKAVLLGMLGDVAAARIEIKRALDADPTDLETRFTHDYIDAVLYHEAQQIEEAFTRFSSFLTKYPDLLEHSQRHIYEDIQQRRAYELLRLLRFQEAVDISQECLNFELSDEDRSSILSNLAVAYTELKDYEHGKAFFLLACKLGLTSPWENQVRFYLGVALAHLREFRDSKAQFLRAAELSASGGVIPLRSVYEWLAWVCRALGEKADAENYSRMAKPF